MTLENVPALIAALAASLALGVHGVIGHLWMSAQKQQAEIEPSELSRRLFGERDITWRAVGVAWHGLSALFLGSAVVLFGTAFGMLDNAELCRFVAILLTAVLLLGLLYFEKTLTAILHPVPLLFGFVMTVATAFAWVASYSL